MRVCVRLLPGAVYCSATPLLLAASCSVVVFLTLWAPPQFIAIVVSMKLICRSTLKSRAPAQGVAGASQWNVYKPHVPFASLPSQPAATGANGNEAVA